MAAISDLSLALRALARKANTKSNSVLQSLNHVAAAVSIVKEVDKCPHYLYSLDTGKTENLFCLWNIMEIKG